MEFVAPFMLFILGISEEDPSAIELIRHPFLYENEAECMKMGRKIVEARVVGEHKNATYFRVFCKPVPDAQEYERLFSELQQDRDSHNDAQEK